MYKVHLNSSTGSWPCGTTNPRETSDNPNDVTCHLCKKWLDNQAALGKDGMPA